MRTDLQSTNLGTIILIEADSARGRRWLTTHVPDADDGYAQCDHRYGIDILRGALDAGLRLRDTTTGRTATRRES